MTVRLTDDTLYFKDDKGVKLVDVYEGMMMMMTMNMMIKECGKVRIGRIQSIAVGS